MRLFIPTIGTRLVLTQDWAFDLHEESRNQKFANQKGLALGYKRLGPWSWADESRITPVTLPTGTVLKVDRIYIRGKARMFDSVSFFCNPGMKNGLRGRFWAKLDCVNNLEIEIEK